MVEDRRQKVIVIGHGYTSRLGVVRALGRSGYEVDVVVMMVNKRRGKFDKTPPIDSYSKYVNNVYYCEPDRDKLISLLLSFCTDTTQKVILFPDSDFSAAAIDLNLHRLEGYFLFPHIGKTQGAVVSWMNKIRQKELAQKVGLNVAKGVVIEVREGQYEIPSEVTYPCFPKPLATLVGAKTGLGRCDSEQQLRESIELLINRCATISILVEEFKSIEQEYALMGVSDGRFVHIPGILRITSLASGSHYGVAKQGEIIPVDGFEDLLERFKAFVQDTGFVGIFDIDFYRSEGHFFFCEMNFRYGGSGYAYTESGVNLPVAYIKSLNGESIEKMAMVKENFIYINERMCLEDWNNGFIPTREFVSLLRNRDISFIFDSKDVRPGRMFKKMALGVCVKRAMKMVLHR